MRQAVDEPAGGETGHPCADDGDALANKEELEVAVVQSSPGMRNGSEQRSVLSNRIVGRATHAQNFFPDRWSIQPGA